ncbi:hypothetical protein BV20DRAFT_51715 [Pilatotrama ljubarskyi]|nr:hypothetical protein BV20DRAFT_51715 [Pilatotrama ljubarskyi]
MPTVTTSTAAGAAPEPPTLHTLVPPRSPLQTDHDPRLNGGPSHVRAQTLDGDPGSSHLRRASKDADHHPLRGQSVASSSAVTLEHYTRPSMRRMLSLDETPSRSREPGEVTERESTRHSEREMLVIVHQARHVRHLKNALVHGDAQPEHPDSASSPSDAAPPSEPTVHQAADFIIRRVPASQLSYFPPPSLSSPRPPDAASTSSQTMPTIRPPAARPAIPAHLVRSQEDPLRSVLDVFSTTLHATAHHLKAYTQSQSSLFSALPIKPATSRLSMESNSATASTASDDASCEHEMDDISTLSSRADPGRSRKLGRTGSPETVRVHLKGSAALRSRSPGSFSPEGRDSVELDSAPFASSEPSRSVSSSPTKHRRDSSSRSQGAARTVPYALADVAGGELERPREGAVRTAQLAPSPEMQLPTAGRRRARSRSRGS